MDSIRYTKQTIAKKKVPHANLRGLSPTVFTFNIFGAGRIDLINRGLHPRLLTFNPFGAAMKI